MIGGGVTLTAAARLAYIMHMEAQADVVAGAAAPDTPTRGTGSDWVPIHHRAPTGTHTDLEPLVKALTPRTTSLVIAVGAAVPSVAYFVQATAVSSMYAAVMAGVSYGAGEAVDRYMEAGDHTGSPVLTENSSVDAVREGDGMEMSTVLSVLMGAPSPGALVRAAGYSLTSLWLTSQVRGVCVVLSGVYY